ncbi:MAG: M23 family metallopeptidase [Thioploca sp.]|nr:M23 family metallopeptidase [Thioploca sp.]
MNKLFLMLLLFFPVTGQAGKITNILFNEGKLIIYHQNCDLKQPIRSSKKLILPLEDCASSAGKIPLSTENLKQIHWAQHDPTTVWIVVTFLTDYQFEMVFSPDKYIVCLVTSCKPKLSPEELEKLTQSQMFLFSLENILFQIPLKQMLIAEWLDRSIGFIPRDLVRDGLPHFGSKRDDWKRKTRKHLGYDIYIDKVDVIAAAPGVVSRVGKSYQAGLYIKLNHDNHLTTVYVHLNQSLVKKGQFIKRGEVIGRIDGAAGNAISPQLHFEIKIKDKSIDPLSLIEKFYQADNPIKEKIETYKQKLIKLSQYRDNLVEQYLLKH